MPPRDSLDQKKKERYLDQRDHVQLLGVKSNGNPILGNETLISKSNTLSSLKLNNSWRPGFVSEQFSSRMFRRRRRRKTQERRPTVCGKESLLGQGVDEARLPFELMQIRCDKLLGWVNAKIIYFKCNE